VFEIVPSGSFLSLPAVDGAQFVIRNIIKTHARRLESGVNPMHFPYLTPSIV